jgi:hypothetical protein
MQAMGIALELSSGMSNYGRMQMMLNLDAAVTANGSPTLKTTYLEKVAKGILGISTQDESDMRVAFNAMANGSDRSSVDKDAKFALGVMLRDIARNVPMNSNSSERAIAILEQTPYTYGFLEELWGKEHAVAVRARLGTMTSSEIRRAGLETIGEAIAEKAAQGFYGDPMTGALQELVEMQQITQETKDASIRAFNDLVTAESEFYNIDEE